MGGGPRARNRWTYPTSTLSRHQPRGDCDAFPGLQLSSRTWGSSNDIISLSAYHRLRAAVPGGANSIRQVVRARECWNIYCLQQACRQRPRNASMGSICHLHEAAGCSSAVCLFVRCRTPNSLSFRLIIRLVLSYQCLYFIPPAFPMRPRHSAPAPSSSRLSFSSASSTSSSSSLDEDEDELNTRLNPHWPSYRAAIEARGFHLDTYRDVKQFYERYWEGRRLEDIDELKHRVGGGYQRACSAQENEDALCRDAGLVCAVALGAVSTTYSNCSLSQNVYFVALASVTGGRSS